MIKVHNGRALLGSGESPQIVWSLPGDREVSPGMCAASFSSLPRACVDTNGTLRSVQSVRGELTESPFSLAYVHPEERGVYTCTALNNQGRLHLILY